MASLRSRVVKMVICRGFISRKWEPGSRVATAPAGGAGELGGGHHCLVRADRHLDLFELLGRVSSREAGDDGGRSQSHGSWHRDGERIANGGAKTASAISGDRDFLNRLGDGNR